MVVQLSNVLNHTPRFSVDHFEHAPFLSNQENWHDGIDVTVRSLTLDRRRSLCLSKKSRESRSLIGEGIVVKIGAVAQTSTRATTTVAAIQ